MTANIQPLHRCLQCAHSLRDPGATPDQIITGKVTHLCLEGPPTTIALPIQAGGLVMTTTYPQVNRDTLSCRRFTARLEAQQ